MAESIDAFLKKNPEHRMVVLAGNGHLAFGSGIPKRAARRNGLEYSILLNDAEIEKGAADYILFPAAIPMEGSPKLMVSLQEEKGQVSIAGFSEGSVSQKAGLQKGDILLSLDEIPVRTVEDVRLELLFKKTGGAGEGEGNEKGAYRKRQRDGIRSGPAVKGSSFLDNQRNLQVPS